MYCIALMALQSSMSPQVTGANVTAALHITISFLISQWRVNFKLFFCTDNPEATSLTARNLKIASYDFTVRSLTVVGECGSTTLRATLNLPSVSFKK